MIAKEELASGLPDVGEFSVDLFAAVTTLPDLPLLLGKVQALLGTVDGPSSPHPVWLGVELLPAGRALPCLPLSPVQIRTTSRTVLPAALLDDRGRHMELNATGLTLESRHGASDARTLETPTREPLGNFRLAWGTTRRTTGLEPATSRATTWRSNLAELRPPPKRECACVLYHSHPAP
jgi:hypothetical protein